MGWGGGGGLGGFGGRASPRRPRRHRPACQRRAPGVARLLPLPAPASSPPFATERFRRSSPLRAAPAGAPTVAPQPRRRCAARPDVRGAEQARGGGATEDTRRHRHRPQRLAWQSAVPRCATLCRAAADRRAAGRERAISVEGGGRGGATARRSVARCCPSATCAPLPSTARGQSRPVGQASACTAGLAGVGGERGARAR